MNNIIFPIIVIYKCHLGEAESFKTFIKPNGFKNYLVYDNSPTEYIQENIASIYPQAIYVRDTSNKGLPAAYNLGAKKAKKLGYKRLLLLDQDTSFPPESLELYLQSADYEGITAPLVKTKRNLPFSPCNPTAWKKTPKDMTPGEYSLKKYSVINSGLCIPTHLFLEVGGYNPLVRLDFADFQFQMRVAPVCDHLKILPMTAIQDFSSDCRDLKKNLIRFNLYLESARHCEFPGWREAISHQYSMLRHVIGLTVNTHSLIFFRKYFAIIICRFKQ